MGFKFPGGLPNDGVMVSLALVVSLGQSKDVFRIR